MYLFDEVRKVAAWRVATNQEQRHLRRILDQPESYTQWQEAAERYDVLNEYAEWRSEDTTGDYDYKDVERRCTDVEFFIDGEGLTQPNGIVKMVNTIRPGLERNIANITAPSLYNRAFAGTKLLIHAYINSVSDALHLVADKQPKAKPHSHGTQFDMQYKMILFQVARAAYGRTALILQAGSMFGLCHLGVVKALNQLDLLPKVIVGTATGAFMAALVGVHRPEELETVLDGHAIDLSAFVAASEFKAALAQSRWLPQFWYDANVFVRRIIRAYRDGYVIDSEIMEQCMRANVGDTTFEEAYDRTGIELNITIPSPGGGVPTVCNYLTAPYTCIWSAAMASNLAPGAPVQLQGRLRNGDIGPVRPPPAAQHHSSMRSTDHDRASHLSRIAEQFGVNHYIVSQARPWLAPFQSPTLHHENSPKIRSMYSKAKNLVLRLIAMEIVHWIAQLRLWGVVPKRVQRVMDDEKIPGGDRRSSWRLVPRVAWSDYLRLLRNPTKDEIDNWILKGQRCVWPAVAALEVRCRIEMELERGYHLTRRAGPYGTGNPYTQLPPAQSVSSVSLVERADFDERAAKRNQSSVSLLVDRPRLGDVDGDTLGQDEDEDEDDVEEGLRFRPRRAGAEEE
nr:putative triacylglycerol lipase [Quercus suber]